MKVSILVVYLIVIFGSISCKTYIDRTNIDLLRAADNGNHDTSDFNVSLEKSRYKSASILSPITKIGHLIGIDSNNFIKSILQFTDFIIGLLTGQNGFCPEKLSIDSIEEIILHPIQMIKTIICYTFNTIGRTKRAIVYNAFDFFSNFLMTVFLPSLHTVLNQIANTGILPQSLENVVNMFNTLYNILRLMGYVK
ncbi:uncharacterized protein LOC114934445 [Nylanderia fulva]|uniref:uncharacterized protein LOC114934445 n=1 Tax=Nylanderia fulva TaxID=613905 RepID=UPI0010FAD23A|nr:uncharacterized protein LOC114934445 [Nylanderia fulva]XP_029162937.1 uncharacterized protein LOC114934445 [Nylanderia fulva]